MTYIPNKLNITLIFDIHAKHLQFFKSITMRYLGKNYIWLLSHYISHQTYYKLQYIGNILHKNKFMRHPTLHMLKLK